MCVCVRACVHLCMRSANSRARVCFHVCIHVHFLHIQALDKVYCMRYVTSMHTPIQEHDAHELLNVIAASQSSVASAVRKYSSSNSILGRGQIRF